MRGITKKIAYADAPMNMKQMPSVSSGKFIAVTPLSRSGGSKKPFTLWASARLPVTRRDAIAEYTLFFGVKPYARYNLLY